MQSSLLSQVFPQLVTIKNKQNLLLTQFSQQIVIPAKHTLFKKSDPCKNFLLVLSGSIKVFSRHENGKEIVLYHIQKGESCVLTTSCILGNDSYPAEGITETDVVAFAIPIAVFFDFLASNDTFRQFVFSSYGQRISSLISLVNTITFSSLEDRLANYLLKNISNSSSLLLTHQEIATELGSAREVISRQLKEFELHGWIRLSRGKIEVINQPALDARLNKSS